MSFFHCRAGWMLSVAVLAAACQNGAEIGWTLGPLREVLPLEARLDDGGLRLQLTLVGWDGRSLGSTDRVRTSAGTYRLQRLEPSDLMLGGRLTGVRGDVSLNAAPAGLRYRPRTWPSRLLFVLDNSTAAAAADPGLARLAGTRAAIDMLACQGCPELPEVSLLAMQGGAVVRVMSATRDRQALDAALGALARGAGGEAPLWDGLLQAVREAGTVGGPAAVVCYTATGAAGPSGATPAEVKALLAQSPSPLVIVVQQQGESRVLVGTPKEDGLWLGLLPGGLETSLRAAVSFLGGSWEARWPLSPSQPQEGQLAGSLELSLEAERRSVALDLPLLP